MNANVDASVKADEQAFVRLDLDLELRVVSPCLFRGLPGLLMGLDASALRDEQGRPVIPGDQLRGCLRDAFEDLATAGVGVSDQDIAKIFGRPSPGEDAEAGAANVPSRAWLTVTDLTAAGLDATRRFETTRIKIDDETGAVHEGMMQVLELIAPFGEAVAFTGRATLFVPSGSEDVWARRMDQAIRLIASIGAVKSAGYGEVVSSSARRRGCATVTLPAAAVVPVARRYRVTFDRPILVDAEWVADNAMAGRAIVPGAVFKGALAQMLVYAGEDPALGSFRAALSALSFSHAFPEGDDGHRGMPAMLPLPMSLVGVSDGGDTIFGDAILGPDGKGAMVQGRPALFQTDWKSNLFGKAAAALGYATADEPPLVARTHTAIDDDGLADDTKLFTTLARSVIRKNAAGHWVDRSWILDVDLSEVPDTDRGNAQRLVALLERGLDGVGKTGAQARLEPLGEPPKPILQAIEGRSAEYAVVLLTPAHMLDAREITEESGGRAAWRKSAFEAYAAYWAAALRDAKLESFFASQRYAGGYLARRRRAHGSEHYYPFLLTDAGSVFRLSNIRGATLDRLKQLCRTGLPAAALGGRPAHWENCPYVPQNGYGQISANHLGGQSGSELIRRVDHV